MTSETQTQHLRTLHRIAKTWNPYDSRFGAIAQDLDSDKAILKANQPLIRCISRHSETAQRLKSFLTDTTLAQLCRIDAAAIPQHWPEPSDPAAALVLQNGTPSKSSDSLHDTANCIFSLSGKQSWLLGRHPNCSVHIPDRYSLVSGHHASIQCETKTGPRGKVGVWHIHDTSRNGTYVNGQLVQDSRPLEMGDRITLGRLYPSETAPLLLFDNQCDAAIAHVLNSSPVFKCEVLWLIIQAHAPVSATEREFFTRLVQSRVPIKMIALDTHASESHRSPSLPPEFIKIAKSIAPNSLSTINCLSVSLPPKDDSDTSLDIPETFLTDLSTVLKDDAETLFSYRLRDSTLGQIHSLLALLSLQKMALSPYPVNAFKEPARDAIAQVKTDVDQSLKVIEKDHKLFFEQAHERLKPVKTELMNNHLRDSISSKIKRFSDQLKPVVIKHNRKRILQLRYKLPKALVSLDSHRLGFAQTTAEHSIDANTALLHFCQTELGQWVNQEWNDICRKQGGGGIHSLATRMFDLLASIPNINLSSCCHSSVQPRRAIAYQEVFNEKFTQAKDETPFQEPSPVSYTLKKIRSQWMQFIFLFSFISIMGIAGRRQIMRYITAPIVAAFNAHPWIVSALVVALIYWIGRSLKQLYQDERQDEREKIAQKIRGELCNHYQSLVRNRLLDRLVKILDAEIDVEKQRLDSILQTVRH
ncbi:MAG: FHA domain-containing protein, partial [Elainellaceae cyanobacterium]